MLFLFMLLVFPILSSNRYLPFQHSVPPRKRGKNQQGSIIRKSYTALSRIALSLFMVTEE